MKIFIIGSTALQARMQEHAFKLMTQGHEPVTPMFDKQDATVISTLEHNRTLMEWADEVHLIYDGRSYGSIFDFGMAFALRKPMKIIYISPKNMVEGMKEYAASCEEGEVL